jgi:hypothetical protein
LIEVAYQYKNNKSMRTTILLFVLIHSLTYAQQAYEFDLTVHNRVDTTKQEVKEIITLWKNYLASNPDSIYDNPHWNEAEKEKYRDFDFTRQFLYRIPPEKLLNYFKPTVLSVVKKNDAWAIRTLFYADGMKGKARKSNPWCITELYAVEENGTWKLKNALPVITREWEQKKAGEIRYIYPPDHQFNDSLAHKSSAFCQRITKKFHLPAWEPFDFYITNSPEKLGKLLGFDFFFVGYTTGMGWKKERLLFTGKGSEWYPHEFIHLILPNNSRHYMMEEGFATWQGGAKGNTFEENAAILAREFAKADSVPFKDILKRKWGHQYLAYYTTGAIICRKAYQENGVKAVKKLLNVPPNNEKLIKTLSDIFEVDENEMDKLIKEEILSYSKE